MDMIIEVVDKVYGSRDFQEDFADRVNYQFSAFLFLFSAGIVAGKQYIGSPITCWYPAFFRKGWAEYARDFCLIENTYYVPLNNYSLPSTNMRDNAEIPYYQWVQFILVGIAFWMAGPHYIWRTLNKFSGFQVKSYVETTFNLKIDDPKRQEALAKLANHIHSARERSRHPMPAMGGVFSVFSTRLLSYTYLVIKVMFIINIVLVMSLLHYFLGFTLADFLQLDVGFTSEWKDTGLFPRSTMCDFEIRDKGNVQRFSIQCVLPLNLLNEKIFLVLFYYLCLLFAFTVGSTLVWAYKTFLRSQRAQFLESMLMAAHVSAQANRASTDSDDAKAPLIGGNNFNRDMRKFINDQTTDTVTALRLVQANAGNITAADLTMELFKLDKKLD